MLGSFDGVGPGDRLRALELYKSVDETRGRSGFASGRSQNYSSRAPGRSSSDAYGLGIFTRAPCLTGR